MSDVGGRTLLASSRTLYQVSVIESGIQSLKDNWAALWEYTFSGLLVPCHQSRNISP